MYNNLPRNIVHAISTQADAILEVVLWRIENDEISDISGCFRTIDDTHLDDTAAIDLDLDDQLTVLEHYGDDYGFDPGNLSFNDLRSRIEGFAAVVICSLAEEEVRVKIEVLEDFMNRYGFDFGNVATENGLRWFRHYAERSERNDCQIYEYRNIDGVHVDLWELSLTSEHKLYFHRHRDGVDLTPEERRFDAV